MGTAINRPSYQLIGFLEWFEEETKSGRWTPSTPAMSTAKIAARSGFREATVRKAILQLAADGRVEVKQRSGVKLLEREGEAGSTEAIVGILWGSETSYPERSRNELIQGLESRDGAISRSDGNRKLRGREIRIRDWAGRESELRQSLNALIVLPQDEEAERVEARKLAAACREVDIPVVEIGGEQKVAEAHSTVSTNWGHGWQLALEHLVRQWAHFLSLSHDPANEALHLFLVADKSIGMQPSDIDKQVQLALDRIEGEIRARVYWDATENLILPNYSVALQACSAWGRQYGAGDYVPTLQGFEAGKYFTNPLSEKIRNLQRYGRKEGKSNGQGVPIPYAAVLGFGGDLGEGLLDALDHARFRVGEDLLLLTLDPHRVVRYPYFLTQVQADHFALGRAAAGLLQRHWTGESKTGEPPTLVNPILRERRSTGALLQKLWRTTPATLVIKSAEGALRYANPRFELLKGKKLSELQGQRPTEYWSGDLGERIEASDEMVRKEFERKGAEACILSSELFPRTGKWKLTFRFGLADQNSKLEYLCSVGFEFVLREGDTLESPAVHPAYESDSAIQDPPYALLNRFFEGLPCSVLMRSTGEPELILYHNAMLRHVFGLPADWESEQIRFLDENLERYYSSRRKEQSGEIRLALEPMPDPWGMGEGQVSTQDGAASPQQQDSGQGPKQKHNQWVLRYPAVGSYYHVVGRCSLGFDMTIANAVSELIERSRKGEHWVAILERSKKLQRGYVVEKYCKAGQEDKVRESREPE